MKIHILLAALLAAISLNASQQYKLMFGIDTPRESTKNFAGFTYTTDKDKCFATNSSFGSQWIYKPELSHPGSMPADTLLEHNLLTSKATIKLPWAAKSATIRIWIGDWSKGWNRYN